MTVRLFEYEYWCTKLKASMIICDLLGLITLLPVILNAYSSRNRCQVIVKSICGLGFILVTLSTKCSLKTTSYGVQLPHVLRALN
ncbi:uncharacterized protein EV420DRAFT_1558756 [Desarmillaria tabescens]|uniref:Uncharacterized protein n=1 Tax=Armillaria tabescens TaxID=1929756 RepID=A0AA39JIJ1_ARMTA|nr:uncharacterized protein EV420DRAFT_1577788 [Desarmillaria tabescens]XP_060327912.1 uncharacterized protein EV420DRAFT_1558756 [Desarmillaria tabescens]KAK0442812.1 hypothetical protein EV420DRAFT_1577788 [Desarmillaria tabescens]KAK0452078.1 hypothetical protein EV420DRAFT_1558756 [Desarmillaria tabescens]